jgi:hypothetical protein
VRLSSALPGNDDINGLDHIAAELVEHPEKLRLVLAWVDVSEVRDVTDTGARVPVVRWRRIEPVGDANNAPQELRDMALRLYEERTGKTPLPIDRLAFDTDGPVD